MSGWHHNVAGELESGIGILQGQKLQLKVLPFIDNPWEQSTVTLVYKMVNFKKSEQLRIGVDGQTFVLKNETFNTDAW